MVRFDPADAVDDAAMLLRRQLASRGITLEWIRRDDPDRMVMGDPGRLQQLVINLLVNARDELEALGEGHLRRISLLCERVGSRVLLVVEDSGRGVPARILDSLFDPFVTARSAGLGLGLSISQEIASEHGSTLRLAQGGSQMTDRMELTNRLRWVIKERLLYDANGDASGVVSDRVLQQLWAGPWRHEGDEPWRETEWRDVPTEDQGQ